MTITKFSIERSDIGRLQHKIIRVAFEVLVRENRYYMSFDYVYHEACKNFIGIHDEFNDLNQELKYSVLCSLINNIYVIDLNYYGLIHIKLTSNAITEFLDKPKEEDRWAPDKKRLLSSFDKIIA